MSAGPETPEGPRSGRSAGSGAGPDDAGGAEVPGLDDLDAYQAAALETAVFPDIGGERCLYPALGLANEAGEVLGKLKKLYRDRGGEVTPAFRRQLASELGDVLWYVAVLADAFDLRVSEIAEENLRKLADRADRDALHGSGDDR